ncbi:Protein of unknown function [Gryllus bimaculatus]|nr:Protein of unknown function [Gryllus bimaculatus]
MALRYDTAVKKAAVAAYKGIQGTRDRRIGFGNSINNNRRRERPAVSAATPASVRLIGGGGGNEYTSILCNIHAFGHANDSARPCGKLHFMIASSLPLCLRPGRRGRVWGPGRIRIATAARGRNGLRQLGGYGNETREEGGMELLKQAKRTGEADGGPGENREGIVEVA